MDQNADESLVIAQVLSRTGDNKRTPHIYALFFTQHIVTVAASFEVRVRLEC